MADVSQLKFLREGIQLWNKWRVENPDIRPDLSGADLRELDLSGADLSSANLHAANLRGVKCHETKFAGADLSGTEFKDASLIFANLERANLSQAGFMFANLFSANLSNANMRETQLRCANLSEANLSGADCTDALMGSTTLANSDLSTVKGLETVFHSGASEIGISTVFRSKGQIPVTFLRQAGVPEQFIEYMHSLVGKGIEYFSCFISYSSKDEDFANRLYSD